VHAFVKGNMLDDAYVAGLQRLIRELHGCPSEHLETVHVQETVQEMTIWQGDVEVFAVPSHPRATRCYAWLKQAAQRNRRRLYAVLGNTVIKTPLDAVKFAHMVNIGPLIDEFSQLVEGQDPPNNPSPAE